MPAHERPRHVEVLNRLSLREAAAGTWAIAWLATTEDPELQALLREVADNETEHGLTLRRRVLDLGHEVRPPDERTAEIYATYLELAASDASDRDKFEAFGWTDPDHGDPALADANEGLLDEDRTTDPWTAALLGRFIAEDRALARRIREVYLRRYAPDTTGVAGP